MNQAGERENSSVIPSFNRSIRIDFRGAKISSDAGVLMLREIDERFNITAPLTDRMEDTRRASHLRHTDVDLIRQRVYQMAAGYEDCNDAKHLRIDPALRLVLGKDDEYAASQSMLSRFENEILGNEKGMAALDETLQRSIDALLRKKGKGRLILDMDSTEDPAHGKQEGVAYNGHFGKSCYHPLFCFSSEADCLGDKLRNGNVHSAEGALEMLVSIVERHRDRFKRFWLRADAAFGKPEIYEYCERKRITYFIRLKSNNSLMDLIQPHLKRPVGRPPKSGIQTKLIDFYYQAGSRDKPRRVICKIEWHEGELFPRIGFIVTNTRLAAGKVVKVYNGRAEIENRIKEGKNALRWDKTSCTRFEANEARLKMGVLPYNLLHMLRKFYIRGEGVRRSIEWLILRLLKVGTRVSYHARRWYVHVASAFPLAHHYQAILGWSF
jgi:hypothetical protein